MDYAFDLRQGMDLTMVAAGNFVVRLCVRINTHAVGRSTGQHIGVESGERNKD
jgi:hypothetical protein